MRNETEMAYAEVDAILDMMDEEHLKKVPDNIRLFFKVEKARGYKPEINPKETLENQKLLRKTTVLLTILYLNYWCESEEEKEEIKKQLAQNDEKKQKEFEEKYSVDNLFKKDKEHVQEQLEKSENRQLMEYKEQNIFQKFWSKIMKFFKKGK